MDDLTTERELFDSATETAPESTKPRVNLRRALIIGGSLLAVGGVVAGALILTGDREPEYTGERCEFPRIAYSDTRDDLPENMSDEQRAFWLHSGCVSFREPISAQEAADWRQPERDAYGLPYISPYTSLPSNVITEDGMRRSGAEACEWAGGEVIPSKPAQCTEYIRLSDGLDTDADDQEPVGLPSRTEGEG